MISILFSLGQGPVGVAHLCPRDGGWNRATEAGRPFLCGSRTGLASWYVAARCELTWGRGQRPGCLPMNFSGCLEASSQQGGWVLACTFQENQVAVILLLWLSLGVTATPSAGQWGDRPRQVQGKGTRILPLDGGNGCSRVQEEHMGAGHCDLSVSRDCKDKGSWKEVSSPLLREEGLHVRENVK